jgi:excisionase family DNA binding protein
MTEKIAYSVEQAARAAGVGRTLMFEEIRNKRLIARKIGRRTVITAEDLIAWLESLPKVRRQAEGDDANKTHESARRARQ